jgi:hypothetical protein
MITTNRIDHCKHIYERLQLADEHIEIATTILDPLKLTVEIIAIAFLTEPTYMT